MTEANETEGGRHEAATQRAEFDVDAPLTTTVGYIEDEAHVPSQHYQYGTLRTDGVGGDTLASVDAMSPAFAIHRARNLRHAARALDPNDVAVPPDSVILPDSNIRSVDAAVEEVRAAARHYIENPVEVGAPGALTAQREVMTAEVAAEQAALGPDATVAEGANA